MDSQNSNSKLKAVILILAICLVGSLIYIFKMTSDANELKTEITTTNSEKEAVMKDLADLKSSYDAAIAENTSMSDELIAERDKIVRLMDELKKSKGDNASLAKYKQQYLQLEQKMKNLMQEVEVLTKKNEILTTNLDSTKVVLEDSKKFNKTLVTQNEELAKTVEKGSKLTITNINAKAYKVRSSGKQIETERAGRADMLKISFTIAENKIAKTGDKNYFIQVIDSKNNVLGKKETVSFGANMLTYSFISTVKYENKTVQITEELPGKDFEKGTYFVNVFDKDELVSKTSFELK